MAATITAQAARRAIAALQSFDETAPLSWRLGYKGEQIMQQPHHRGTGSTQRPLSFRTFGLSLSLFLTVSYLLCVAGYLLFPGLPISHSSLSIFLPGFQLLSWQTFCLGLIESFLWGWYVALVFVPLYNFFASRQG